MDESKVFTSLSVICVEFLSLYLFVYLFGVQQT